MPPPSRSRAASPSPRKNNPTPAGNSSSSSSSSSHGLESNQVVLWAVYCCIAVAVVALAAYTYGSPMLARAFADNTRSMTGGPAAAEASSAAAAAKDAYDKAKEALKAAQGDALSTDKLQLLRLSFYAALAVAAVVFVVGEATGNYSQVDKLWSILPVAYTLAYTHYSGYNSRLVLLSACTLVWGARLTCAPPSFPHCVFVSSSFLRCVFVTLMPDTTLHPKAATIGRACGRVRRTTDGPSFAPKSPPSKTSKCGASSTSCSSPCTRTSCCGSSPCLQ